jgi:hypothetical protein
VTGVDELEPGAADGVGQRLRLLFRTRLPYTLGFDVQVTRVEPPFRLEALAAGELDGTGRWTLTSADGGTLVRYDWDVRTTRRWMNLLAPATRPVFRWNARNPRSHASCVLPAHPRKRLHRRSAAETQQPRRS